MRMRDLRLSAGYIQPVNVQIHIGTITSRKSRVIGANRRAFLHRAVVTRRPFVAGNRTILRKDSLFSLGTSRRFASPNSLRRRKFRHSPRARATEFRIHDAVRRKYESRRGDGGILSPEKCIVAHTFMWNAPVFSIARRHYSGTRSDRTRRAARGGEFIHHLVAA